MNIEGNTREAYDAALNCLETKTNFSRIDSVNQQMPLLDYQSEQNSNEMKEYQI